jgi:hypothetical protein
VDGRVAKDIAQCVAREKKETSPSERLLQSAGYRVIARPTEQAGDEIGSAVWIVPDECVDIIIAACGTGCKSTIVVIHLVFSPYIHLCLTRNCRLGTHENPGAKFEMTPEMAGEAEF